MRRTTICRSNPLALGLVAVPLVWGLLQAQQDTVPAGAAPAQLPESHTVVRGETLWGIAQQYYGDALLWPEIYRLNTAVVEDPHWIYPGEVLNLAPGALAAAPADTAQTVPQGVADTVAQVDTAAAPPMDTVVAAAQAAADTVPVEPPPPPAAEENAPTFFDQRAAEVHSEDVVRTYYDAGYRPLRRSEFYTAGFLTESEALPFGQVLGSVEKPSINVGIRTVAQQYEMIAVRPPEGASYHIGDSLLVSRIDREIEHWGKVVVPMGIARVVELQDKQVIAEVVTQYGRINYECLALPLEPFRDPGAVRPAPVENGLQAFVIDNRDKHILGGMQNIFFVDKGRADGVALGDVFEVYEPAKGDILGPSERVKMQLLIVHIREHSASGLVIGVKSPDVRSGMPARLVRKMPS